MLTSLFGRRFRSQSNRAAKNRRRAPRARLGTEFLEARTLMSVNLPGTVEPVVIFPPDVAGGGMSTAVYAAVSPMGVRTVSDNLPGSNDIDAFRVHLNAGDFLAADLDTTSTADTKAILTIRDAAGNTLGRTSRTRSLDALDPRLGVWAEASGDYYVSVSSWATDIDRTRAYDLNLQRIGLDDGRLLREFSRTESGDMYAWLHNGTLTVSGSTGHGFQIGGNWQQSVVDAGGGQTRSTYTATRDMTLHTDLGDIPLQVPSGETFRIQNTAGPWGNQFGRVSSIDGHFGFGLGDLADDIEDAVGLDLSNVSLASKWTIKSGSDVKSDLLVDQVHPNFPYLVYSDHDSVFSVELGPVTFTSNDLDDLVIVADPADPMLYVGKDGYAVAGSLQGLIPFDPAVSPTAPGAAALADMYGHVFAEGSFPLAELPITVDGELTLNLDANRDGHWLAGNGNAAQLLDGDLAAVDAVLADLEVGVNGRVNFGYDIAGYGITVPLGAASAVYSGPEKGIWAKGVKGDTSNPWAGTVLAPFAATESQSIEGVVHFVGSSAYPAGYFQVTTASRYAVAGIEANLTFTIDSYAISARGTTRALGVANIELAGTVNYNGNFALTGSADLSFGGLHGHGEFRLAKQGTQTQFTAYVNGTVNWTGRDPVFGTRWGATASIWGTLTITRVNGSLRYTGTLGVSGTVTAASRYVGSFGGSFTVSSNRIRITGVPLFDTLSLTFPQ